MNKSKLQAWGRLSVFAAFIACPVAYAAIPDSNGIIHGCYKNASKEQGALRVIDREAGETCRNNENALQWAQAYAAPAKTSVNSGAEDSLIVPGDFSEGMATVSITAPAKGRVLVNGMTTILGLGPDNMFVAGRLRDVATGIHSSIQGTTVPSGTASVVTIVWMFEVAAGEHEFALDLKGQGAGVYNPASRTITAIFVPD